jgi:hypothetical protein
VAVGPGFEQLSRMPFVAYAPAREATKALMTCLENA